MTRVLDVPCRTALRAALWETGKMARTRTHDAGTSGHRSHWSSGHWSHSGWSNNRSGVGWSSNVIIVHHTSTTVSVAFRETVVVAGPMASWEHGRWGTSGRVVFVRVKSTACYRTTCTVTDVWFGARLCAHSDIWSLLYWSVGSQISGRKSN